MKNVSIWLCCALLALPAAVRAQDAQPQPETQEPAQDAAETPQSVDQKLEELDQKIRVLDRKIEIDKEAAAEKAKTAGQAVAGKDGFSLRSADGNFVLKVRGYAQFDGRFWVDDEQEAAGGHLPAAPRAADLRGDGLQDLRLPHHAGLRRRHRPCSRTPMSRGASTPPSGSAPASSSRRSASSGCSRPPTSCSSSARCPPTWCPTATSASRSAAISPAAR